MPLQIEVPAGEYWNANDEEFVRVKRAELTLEHSLVSISKWEAKWHQAFLDPKKKKSEEMVRDYIRCMTIEKNVDPNVYYVIPPDKVKEIADYIDDPMSATTVNRSGPQSRHSNEVMTSELIYYSMTALQIPFECEKWHLNRLLKLIEVCSIKNAPPKKMSKRDTVANYAAINAARRKANHSRG